MRPILPRPFRCLPMLALPLLAGGLQGPVRILEKNGRDRGSLQDCVAILEPENPQAVRPGRTLTIKTVGKQFEPRVSIATPGTEVVFPNLDHILHNVFSVTQGNRFDTGHYLPGEAPKVKIANTGLVKLYCNVHHQMNAFLWVVDTPYAQTLTGRSGLDFGNLPAGAYRLRLRHPETGERTWNIRIGADTSRGTWDLQVNLPAVEPHLNKFGKNYPPPAEERGY